MNNRFVGMVALATVLITGCSGGSQTEDYSVIIGKVTDSLGITLGDVDVTAADLSAKTNYEGYFSINKIPVTDRLVVNFQKQGYVSTTQVTATQRGESIFLNAVMAPVAGSQTMNAATGGTVTTSDGASVQIPASGLVTASGSPYTGTATISITTFDPTTAQGQDSFPGEFKGVDKNGQVIPFASYGYVDVSLQDSTGGSLQLASGQTATLGIPIPSSLLSQAPASIPFWFFDPKDAQWHEESSGTKSGSVYSGTVSHFSVWNSDVGYDRSYVKGRVVDCTTMTPIPCARVLAKGISPRNCWTSGETCTGSDGSFVIAVDANSVFEIFASKGGIESQHQQLHAPALEVTQDIGDLCINEPKIKITTTWGPDPGDLDAHLTFPGASGREHVYFGNPTASDGSAGLDTDATSGYGPEIISVLVLHDGVYRFGVHHFSGDGNLSTSGVSVDMIIGGKGIYHKSAPGGATGVLDAWALWDIEVANGAVTAVRDLDTIQHTVDSTNTAAFSP